MALSLSPAFFSTAQCQVAVGPVALYCDFFYRPVMVIVVVIIVVVAAFVNVVAAVVFGAGRPPNGPLSTCHPTIGENEKAGL